MGWVLLSVLFWYSVHNATSLRCVWRLSSTGRWTRIRVFDRSHSAGPLAQVLDLLATGYNMRTAHEPEGMTQPLLDLMAQNTATLAIKAPGFLTTDKRCQFFFFKQKTAYEI